MKNKVIRFSLEYLKEILKEAKTKKGNEAFIKELETIINFAKKNK